MPRQALRMHTDYGPIFQYTADAVVVVAPDGRIAAVNPRFQTLTGYPAEEILGHPFDAWLSDVALSDILGRWERHEVLREVAFTLFRRNDNPCLVAADFVPLAPEAGYMVLVREQDTSAQEREEGMVELVSIGEIVEGVNRSLQLEAVLNRAVSVLPFVAELGNVAIYTLNDDKDPVVLNFDASLIEAFGTPDEPESVVGHTLRLRQIFSVEDVDTQAHSGSALQRVRAAEVRAFVCVPLIVNGSPVGYMILASRYPQVFLPRRLAVLNVAARVISAAIHNAELFEREQYERAFAQTLRRISEEVGQMLSRSAVFDFIASEFRAIMGADYCFILRSKPSNELTIVSAAGESAEQWLGIDIPDRPEMDFGVHSEGKSVILNSFPDPRVVPHEFHTLLTNTRAALVVPLRRAGKITGSVAMLRSAGTFTQTDADRLETLAGSVTGAIRNTELFEELRRTRDALEIEVRERTAELRQTNAMLMKLLHSVSHEIVQPLQGILNGAKDLSDLFDQLSRDQKLETLRMMYQESQLLRRLQDDLSTLALLRDRKLRVDRIMIRLDKFLEDFVARRARLRDAWPIDLHIAPALREQLVPLDRARIGQVLDNLVDNAKKYGAPPILLHARREGEHVQIAVEDRGRGVPSGVLESIFVEFERGHAAGDSNKSGLGLGLAICRDLVKLHFGRIWAENVIGGDGDVVGARFVFTLALEL